MAKKKHVDFNAIEWFLRYKDYPSVVQSNFRWACKKFSLENNQLMKDMGKVIVFKDRQRIDAAQKLICKALGNEKSYKSVLTH